jgi:mono/diheme cytochrome c family protein
VKWIGIVVMAVVLGACHGVAEDAGGAEIYAAECARCHGSELQGGVGPSLGPGSDAAARSDEFLITTITRGRSPMPAFGEALSEEQILRVVRYIRERQG